MMYCKRRTCTRKPRNKATIYTCTWTTACYTCYTNLHSVCKPLLPHFLLQSVDPTLHSHLVWLVFEVLALHVIVFVPKTFLLITSGYIHPFCEASSSICRADIAHSGLPSNAKASTYWINSRAGKKWSSLSSRLCILQQYLTLTLTLEVTLVLNVSLVVVFWQAPYIMHILYSSALTVYDGRF